MRTLLDSDEYDMRYSIGIGQPSSSLKLCDRDRIVQAFATHFTIITVKAELDQMTEGLKALGVLQLIHSNPKKMRQLFVRESKVKLTADILMDIFRFNLSPLGSNTRECEETVIMHWVNYLQMIEGKKKIG